MKIEGTQMNQIAPVTYVTDIGINTSKSFAFSGPRRSIKYINTLKSLDEKKQGEDISKSSINYYKSSKQLYFDKDNAHDSSMYNGDMVYTNPILLK